MKPTRYLTTISSKPTIRPMQMDSVITATVCFPMVFLSGQMIFLNSAFSVFHLLVFFFASSIAITLSDPADYLVSLCIVCLLQNGQYFFVSILSGCSFFSFVML